MVPGLYVKRIGVAAGRNVQVALPMDGQVSYLISKYLLRKASSLVVLLR